MTPIQHNINAPVTPGFVHQHVDDEYHNTAA